MSLRIIGGKWKNISLQTPKTDKTRPTTGMVRKAVFDICQSMIEDANVLDLFAGTGAMGIEALSRGAKSATFVEIDPQSLLCLNANLKLFELSPPVAKVMRGEAIPVLKKLTGPFELIYVDPPYGYAFHDQLLQIIVDKGLLASDGILFIEDRFLKHAKAPTTTLLCDKIRKYGKTVLYQYSSK